MSRRVRIGYYVHHAGSGHRHRAAALAERLLTRGVEVTALSSAPRPPSWPAELDWLALPRDDDPAPTEDIADVTAAGRLHWVPVGHRGLAGRMAALSGWLDGARPALIVSDVSQEVTLLARLHGVRVVSVLLPGRRDDAAHDLGLSVSDEVVGFWPALVTSPASGLAPAVADRVRPLGGQSRFAPAAGEVHRARHLVVLAGTGGGAEHVAAAGLAAARLLPGWTSEVLGGERWVEEPFEHLRRAAVVLTHAGQNAVAEVAAARVPAVVVPQERPFGEQRATAAVLPLAGMPVVVVEPHAAPSAYADAVGRAARLDGAAWSGWVDGQAADRFADLVLRTLAGAS